MGKIFFAAFLLSTLALTSSCAHRSSRGPAAAEGWVPVFADPGTDTARNWQDNWVMDGAKGQLRYTPQGMFFASGAGTEDQDHAVIWAKPKLQGDLWIEFEFIREDRTPDFVNMLLLQASGTGGKFKEDIMTWSSARQVPAGTLYQRKMNNFSVSFATGDKQVRCRQNSGRDLLEPAYSDAGLFEPGVLHRIVVTKTLKEVVLQAVNLETKESRSFSWKADASPVINDGYFGIRLMSQRSSYFRNLRIFQR